MHLFYIFVFLIFNWNLASARTETIKIGLMDSRPFFWKENGKATGFHFEIAKALADKMKVNLVVKEAPILRMINMLKKGDVDVVIVTDHKELEAIKVKKELLLKLDSLIYTLSDQPITSKEEIKGTIGRLSSSCSSLENHPGIDWLDAASYEQAYVLLKMKRIRAVCGTVAFQIVANPKQADDGLDIKSFVISKKALWVQARPEFDSKRWHTIQKNVHELSSSGYITDLAKTFSK